MELVEIGNILPEYKITDVIELGGADEINAFASIVRFTADIKLNFSSGTVNFFGVMIEEFAKKFMNLAFSFNFYPITKRQEIVLGETSFIMIALISDESIGLTISLTRGPNFKLNGIEQDSNVDINLQVGVLEFNRICRDIFGKSLEILADKFDGIDGVDEYFSSISYSEGFFQFWSESMEDWRND
jgi:hypothetical protein